MAKSAWTASLTAVALLWTIMLAAGATDFGAIGPQASAAQIIAAHGVTTGPVLRVVYESPLGTSPVAIRYSIDIASEYVFVKQSVAEGQSVQTTLYDYQLKRIIFIDETRHAFANMSMYGTVDFRYYESYNRRTIRAVMGKAGLQAKSAEFGNPYWDQQALQIADVADGPVPIKRESTNGGGLRFIVDGENAASFEPSTESLSPSEMKGLARFLRANVTLHPAMVDAIMASGKVPSDIASLEIFGDKRTERQWKLVSVERTTGSYPLSSDNKPDLLSPDSNMKLSEPLHSLLPIMFDAIAGRYHGGPRSIADYRTALADALAHGNVLQHYALDNEFLLQYGLGTTACLNGNPAQDDCSHQQDIAQQWLADGRTHAMIDSFGPEGQGDYKSAIAQRKAIAHDDLSNPYMFDIWIGNAMTEGGDNEGALSLLPNGIRGNPYIGSFYKDLGDAFRHSFEPMEAWTCYDLGRALPGGDTKPIVVDIAKIEEFLETKYPEFF